MGPHGAGARYEASSVYKPYQGMVMSFTIRYHESVLHDDIPRLPARMRERIKRAIQERLMMEPELYGKPLRRSLYGYRKLRVGDYRVIFNLNPA